MKEIFINVDSFNSDSIGTIQNNNNCDSYKIYILKNKRRLDITNKTVRMCYVRTGTKDRDIIDLEITNAKEGEVTLPVTNRITAKDGVYCCQLAIYGENNFLEHTTKFTLTVESNIFAEIAEEIANRSDFSYLENILYKSEKLSEKLKENTSSATNANSNLEANITEANNINSKLLENTSTATSLNKNLESNIELAKEVKETIKDLDTKNIEATEKIEELTDLNNKAQELSNNINQALPINAELIKNTEEAKTANTNLAATNQEATSKNTELQASLEKTKEFIEGLDGSQNIPQIRLDVDALQNGLKSNQALSYEGGSISAENTLEGRTEGMRIGGRTLVNLLKDKIDFISSSNSPHTGQKKLVFATSPNKPFTFIADIKYTGSLPTQLFVRGNKTDSTFVEFGSIEITSNLNGKIVCVCKQSIDKGCSSVLIGFRSNSDNSTIKNAMILEGDWTNKEIPSYFEGLKSFGEAEKVGDKYKISILSSSLTNIKFEQGTIDSNQGGEVNVSSRVRTGFIEGDLKSIANSNFDSSKFDIIVYAYDSDKRFLKITSVGWSDTINVDFPPNTKYARMCIKYKNDSIINVSDVENLYFGKQHKKDILIKEPLREGDYLYEDNGQVKVCRNNFEVKLATLNFIKSNVAGGTDINTIRFSTQLPNSLDSKGGTGIISNFPILSESTWDKDKENMQISGGNLYIRINKSKLLTTQDVEGFKAWLKENPITVVYQLATPVTEVVDGVIDIDLDTFGEKTYFNILNSIKGSLDFKVPSNIASIVQSNSKAINELYNLIDTLVLPNILQNTTDIEMLKLEKLK